jgi:putative spermidine/putrescine transport system substrate-binding protein
MAPAGDLIRNKEPSNMSAKTRHVSRRAVLAGLAGGATAVLGSPAVRAQASAGQVVVRGLGGAYQTAMEKAIYTPFTEATGIKVVTQPATAAQVRAMVEAKRVQIDVVDLGSTGQLALQKVGALEPLDYSTFKLTNPDDLQKDIRLSHMVGSLYFSTVMVYNTEAFSADNHPHSWAEFWDLKRFPGARTLADQTSGAAEFEFALLADGVPMDKLYPINLDRAFASLDRVKGGVVKWWDTGAVSAQLLERKEAVLGGLWNGRAQDLIDKGAPLAIEWNEAKRLLQALSIVKDAPNLANAQRFIDFSLQPKVQAELTRSIAYGPTNKKAFEFVRPEDAAKLPSEPKHFAQSFDQDQDWWGDNLTEIGRRWQAWVLKR